MDTKTVMEEQIKRWGAECDSIDAERRVLRHASAILGDDLLKHSIELWDMKMVRLQRCMIDLQGVVMDVNFERMRELERANSNSTSQRNTFRE